MPTLEAGQSRGTRIPSKVSGAPKHTFHQQRDGFVRARGHFHPPLHYGRAAIGNCGVHSAGPIKPPNIRSDRRLISRGGS
jgi:hypothetical protein